MPSDLDKGRRHYARQEWADAFETLSRAQQVAPLDLADLDRLVWSAGLVGADDDFLGALERSYLICCEQGGQRKAARYAFWIWFRLFATGSSSRAGAWLTRAESCIGKVREECAERGYLLLPAVFRHLFGNENNEAERVAGEARAIGDRNGDPDLVAIACNLQGRALLRLRQVDAGLALLDGAMLSVTSGEVSPLVAGIVYCNVIASCNQVLAVDRAREWTAALAAWIERQPQLVNFTGTCLVHRSEVLQMAGRWVDALEEIQPVCDGICKDKDPEVIADACYQQGELFRLAGEFERALQAYRNANRHGRDPQPGLALLRLAEGQVDEAAGSIERVLATTRPMWKRIQILPAYFEIMYKAGRLDLARKASDELSTIADEFGTDILGAIATQTRGAMQLADGNARDAVKSLRHSFSIWNRAGAPYIAARIRVMLARAYDAMGDTSGAEMEIEAARGTFEQLGAMSDLQDIAALQKGTAASGLSPRELGVLKHLASGKTNKAIANELGISERTIDRHVSNIFSKLDVSTRAAATAAAYRKKLV